MYANTLRLYQGFDMTQEELATQLEKVTVSSRNKREESQLRRGDVHIRIKERLRVSIDWLLTGEE
jgi:hypothetical protein